MATITALVPAHNEQDSIGTTIEGLLAQDRLPDGIVVIPNGCTDNTAEIVRSYTGVSVLELPRLEHKKAQALNTAWNRFVRDSDIVVCLDSDTYLPPNAVEDWETEFLMDESRQNTTAPLGGSSSKFTMLGNDFLSRLQRAEFSRWTDTGLSRGWTSVLAGTGCAISGEALRQVVTNTGREGPWSYDSQVEDFELTYMIRSLGYRCQISREVRAYTDSMKTVKSLWGQRMKWQVGTVEDLLSIGFNRQTAIDWWQQFCGLFMAAMRLLWAIIIIAQIAMGFLTFQWIWFVVVPAAFASMEFYSALRIPNRDRIDIFMAVSILPTELFAWLRAGWFVKAWIDVLLSRITGRRKDRWQLQYAAEGIN